LMALRQTADLVPAKRLATLAAVGLLSIAGLCAYEGFLVARYDRVDAYFVAQRDWEPAAAQEAPAVSAPDAVLPTAQVSPSEPRAEGPASGIVRRLTSPGAWNRVFVVVILGLSIFGLIRPGPIPREAFLLPILIFLVGWVPGWGARTTSIARFETAAIPCFVLVSYLLRKRTEWRWALIGAGFLLECGVYAVQVARGVWGG
jgi:hypothetical protein